MKFQNFSIVKIEFLWRALNFKRGHAWSPLFRRLCDINEYLQLKGSKVLAGAIPCAIKHKGVNNCYSEITKNLKSIKVGMLKQTSVNSYFQSC